MNEPQKRLLKNFLFVCGLTVAMVIGMVNFKDWVNRKEAMQAMEHLSRIVLDYRKDKGTVPPSYFVDGIKHQLQGARRLGTLVYRARWIEYGAPDETILAYVRKDYHSLLFKPGAIVLRLDGRVEWMDKKEFDELLARQQSPLEVETERQKQVSLR